MALENASGFSTKLKGGAMDFRRTGGGPTAAPSRRFRFQDTSLIGPVTDDKAKYDVELTTRYDPTKRFDDGSILAEQLRPSTDAVLHLWVTANRSLSWQTPAGPGCGNAADSQTAPGTTGSGL